MTLPQTRFYVHPDGDAFVAEGRGRNAFDSSPPTRDTAAGNFKIVLKDFEVIKGSAGRDVLLGNDEANIFQGGAGRDWIEGAGGDDTLDGGTGADTYLYRYTTSDQDGIDTITDSDGSNTIRIVVDDFTKPWRDMIEVQRTVSEVKLFMKDSMGNKDEDNVIILQSADVDALNFKLEFTPTADATDAADIRGVSARSLYIESTPGAGLMLTGTAGNDDKFVVVPGTTTHVTGDSGDDDTISFQDFSLNTDTVNLDLSSGAAATVTRVAPPLQSIAVSDIRSIIGSAGADTLTGDAQANTLRGSGGDDILDGKEEIDTLEGGDGADTLTGGDDNDILIGGKGIDTYIFAGNSGEDTITETEAGVNSILRFQDLATNVDWQEHFNFALNGNELTIKFSADLNNPIPNAIVKIADFSLAGDFKFEHGTTSGNVLPVILGTTGDDTTLLDGGAEDDYLVGFGGADTLTGGEGDDTLDGGTGTDTYIFSGDSGIDTILGESGNNILLFSDATNVEGWQNDFTFALDSVADELTITFGKVGESSYSVVKIEDFSTAGTFEFRYGAGGTTDTLNVVFGSTGNDAALEGGADTTLRGGMGNDYLLGFGGDDTLEGGEGLDALDGGIGTDTLSYANEGGNAGDVGVAVNLATSTSTDNGTTTTRDTISNFENVIGSSAADTLTGDDNDNILEGGLGEDTLAGGLGDDTYVYHYTDIGGADERRDGNDLIEDGDGRNTIVFHVDDTGLDSINMATFSSRSSFGSDLQNVVSSLAGGASVSPSGNSLRLFFKSNFLDDIVDIRLEDIKEGKIALEFVGSDDTKGTIAADKLQSVFFPDQEFNYDAAGTETFRTGPGDVTVNLESLTDFGTLTDFDAKLQHLLQSGLFSYEVDMRDKDNPNDDQLLLTFGGGGGTDKKTLRLDYPPPDIIFVDSGDNKLEFPTDSFLTKADLLTIRTPDMDNNYKVTDTSTYLVAGTFLGTDDTADFSGLSDKIVLDLTIGTATIGTGGDVIAVGNIEHITGGSGDDILAGDGGDNRLTGGTGADTYVYHYTDIGGADERKDGKVTITSEADGGNTIRIVVDGSPAPVFQKHFDSSDTEIAGKVRLSFDDTNYIVLDRADLDDDITAVGGNSKFQLEIMGTTIDFMDTNTAYEDFVDKSTPQDYTYSKDVADNVDLIGLGPVTIDISSLGSPGINFSGTTSDAKLKALMTRGLFSYEVDTDGNTVLAFGDGSTGFPIKKVTLNSSPPDITFVGVIVDGTSTELKFLASAVPNFLTSLNDHTLNTHTDNNYEVTNANIADIYLIKGSPATDVSDTVDFSGVSAFLIIDLATKEGSWVGLGTGNFALVDIENIKGSDGILYGDNLTGNANDNTIEGGLGTDQLNGGAGADTYVYYYTGTRQDGADTITSEADGGNTIKIYVTNNTNPAWGEENLVYFQVHTNVDDAEAHLKVRIAFGSDLANYIVLDRADLDDDITAVGGNSKFKLEIFYKQGDLDVAVTMGAPPTTAALLNTAYENFVDRDIPQEYTYPATDKSLTNLGDVTIDVRSLGISGIDFSGTTDERLEALLASGLFSYEQGVDNVVLTFGDDTPAYPLRNVTLKISPPDIKFVGASSTELNFPASGTSFINTLNSHTIRTPAADNKYKVTDTNKGDTYLIQGSSDPLVEDTADFSGVTDSVLLNLATRKGTLDGHAIAAIDIENITGGSADDRLTGDDDLINTNTLTGGLGDDTLMGGMGEDTYVYHYTSLSGGKHGADTITEVVDVGVVNIIKLYVDDPGTAWMVDTAGGLTGLIRFSAHGEHYSGALDLRQRPRPLHPLVRERSSSPKIQVGNLRRRKHGRDIRRRGFEKRSLRRLRRL